MDILRENLKILLKVYTQEEITNLCDLKDRSVFSKFVTKKSETLSLNTLYLLSKKLKLNIDDLCNKKLVIKFEFEEVNNETI